MNTLSLRAGLSALLLVVLHLLLGPGSATAAVIPVNVTGVDAPDADVLDGDCDIDVLTAGLQCTLRAAVMTANASGEADTIVLPPGETISLNLVGDGGAELGDLNLTEEVSIVGFVGDPPASQADLPIIQAAALNDRIFLTHSNSTVVLRGLVLQGGSGGLGGAIRSHGTLHVDHSVLSQNSSDFGGAIRVSGPAPVLLVTDSHFERNHVTNVGAAISTSGGNVEIWRSSFLDNRGPEPIGSTISLTGSGTSALIANSILDGTPLVPPIGGLSADIGIRTNVVDNLVIRNSTLDNFAVHAVRMDNLESGARVRIANSVLAGGSQSCRALGADMAMADVVIRNSLVQSQQDCDQFFEFVIQGSVPQLGNLSQRPGWVTRFRSPSGAFSNVVDRGIDPAEVPADPELACTATDQAGNPRPLDGNGDDIAICDLGAVEEGPPPIFIVDYAGEDLEDEVPGNGVCDILTLAPGATCTLRAAVMEANAMSGLQRIHFADGLDPIVLDRSAAGDAAGGDLDLTDFVYIEGNTFAGLPVTEVHQTELGERLFDIDTGDGGVVRLRRLHLSGGQGVAEGGALRIFGQTNLSVEGSLVSGNSATGSGGGVFVGSGQLLMVESDISGNQAGERGAGLAVVGSQALAVVSQGSFTNNVDAGLAPDGILDSIYAGSEGQLVIHGSTIAANSGGIQAHVAGRVVLNQVTIAANGQHGLAVHAEFGFDQDLAVSASVIADNSATDCAASNLHFLDAFEVAYVLSSDGSCDLGSSTALQGDPMLSPLARPAGRSTWIMAPVYDANAGQVSPLLDVAPEAVCGRTDQHGRSRPQDLSDVADLDGSCDLGAIETGPGDMMFSDRFES